VCPRAAACRSSSRMVTATRASVIVVTAQVSPDEPFAGT
jgi:hypothetical protein